MKLSDIHTLRRQSEEPADDGPLTFRQQHFLDGILRSKARYEAHPVLFVFSLWAVLSVVWVGGAWILVGLEPWVRANVPAGQPGLPADWVHPLAAVSSPFAWLVHLGLPLIVGWLVAKGQKRRRAAWADPVVAAKKAAARQDAFEKQGTKGLVSWKIWMS